MARLYLLDGTALAFRSHYAFARSQLTAADGTPTGATYGFTTTLRRILDEEQPDLFVVAFDAPGDTFRHRQFADYKATRQKAPEEMLAQLGFLREVVEAHGLPLFEIPDFEADDVIATLARQAENAGHDVRIVTGDKDFMQLVGERVKLHNIFKAGEPTIVQGVEEVREKFGVGPEHVIDVLAIMGDASDNVPGVKGIGEKGAIQLVSKFGSVEKILEHLDELTPKQREKLEASREMLLLSRELVTIDCEVPLDRSFADLEAPKPDNAKLRELFGRLAFTSLLDQVAERGTAGEADKRDYVLVEDRAGLDAMAKELSAAGVFSIDTETTSLFPLEAELVGISFSCAVGRAYYVPCNAFPPVVEGGTPALIEALRALLTDPGVELVGQNTKYDWLVLREAGLELPPPSFDTMVASFTAAGSQRRHSLDSLALSFFGLNKIPTTELIGKGKKQVTMADVPIDQVCEYACEDAEVTFRLRDTLAEELERESALSLFHDLEMPLVPVLGAMEHRGIRLDQSLLAGFAEEMEGELVELKHAVQEHAGENVNVNSPKALGEVLFEKLRIQDEAGVKRPKRTRTGWATDAETLSTKYGDVPIVQKLLEYRELAKLKSTYVDALPKYVNARTGRVHCSFSQVSAATGRLASSDPNLQNIPVRSERGRQIRKAFVPREPDELGEWVLFAADYSQIELRVMAHLSGDETMREVFQAGHDVHDATARRIFDVGDGEVTRAMRSQAKVINFGLLYGMGPARVARETGLSRKEAEEFVERYFASFPTIRAWMDQLLEGARENGYVETLFGRRRKMPEINSSNPRLRVFAENAAINTPVQGSAADIIKRAMILLEDTLERSPLASRMLLQVHDELVLEVPKAQLEETTELVRKAMEEAVELAVPLRIDVGHGANWLEAH